MTEDQQDQLVISLDTQYAVAHAIYNRFQGIDMDVIDHDPNTCSNSMGDGIRSLAIYGKD